MGVSTFAHPRSQAFALPPYKDKQRSQPTPSDYMFNILLYTLLIYRNCWDIIYPRRRSVALPLCTVLSCEVRDHRMITSVNAFPPWPALQTASSALGFHQCHDPPCPRLTGLIECKYTNFSINKQIFYKKSEDKRNHL